ncbi:MAG: 7TM domain-containing protein [Patescibacteria group bacterium]
MLRSAYPIVAGLACLLLALPLAAAAQINTPATPTAILQVVIVAEDTIPLGKKVLFDASESAVDPAGSEAVYRWEFTDTPIKQVGREVVHDFTSTGIHRVTLTVQQGESKVTADQQVFVYDRQVLMVSDQRTADELKLLADQAANAGVLLKVVTAVPAETGFLTEEKLVPLIGEESEFIMTANALIFSAPGSVDLQAFTRYWQSLDPDKQINLDSKLLVKITDQSIGIAAKLAQQSYQVILPRYILVTRHEALNPIFESKDYNLLTTTLQQRAVEFQVVDARSEKSPLFFLSHAITNFVTKGIATNTIYLLLVLPFIAFAITFARQVIGLSTFGVYTPLVIALSLFILGIYFGLATLVIVVIVSYLLRTALNRFRILYISKTSLILSCIGLSFLGVIWFLSYYRLSLAVSLAIFPMLVMSTLSEKFLSAQSEEGLRGALLGVIKTVAVAVASYYLVVWPAFTNLVMSWPELVIVPLVGILLLGKFTGLRLTEYFRFRSLLKEADSEE